MDLTPEERRRIYEVERVRIEAQENIKKQKQAMEADGANKGCLVTIAVVLGIVLLFYVVGQLSELFPSAEDVARKASSARQSDISKSLEASKEALTDRAVLYTAAGLIEEMGALFEARWREMQKLEAQIKADTSMSDTDKKLISSSLEDERLRISGILRSHTELRRRHIKGRSVRSVTVLNKDIKLGDSLGYVVQVFPYEGHYEAYDSTDSGPGSDEEPQSLQEHLYITPDVTLEVAFSNQLRVARLFVRANIPAPEQRPALELGDDVSSIVVRGKQLSVGDQYNAEAFKVLKDEDWIARPTVEADPKDGKVLRATQYYSVGAKRFALVLGASDATSQSKPQVERIALLK